MSYDELVSEIRSRAREGANIEDTIRFMRESGLDVMDSIMALKDAKLLGANDAKRAVFKSAVWADAIEPYQGLHDVLIEEIDRKG